jgi:hypothetical protein
MSSRPRLPCLLPSVPTFSLLQTPLGQLITLFAANIIHPLPLKPALFHILKIYLAGVVNWGGGGILFHPTVDKIITVRHLGRVVRKLWGEGGGGLDASTDT